MADPAIAIALRYAWSDGAPTVTASGKGALATRIVDEAVAHGVPVHADAQLAGLLAKTPVGTAIPPAAFLAVAQLLSFLYDVDRLIGEQRRS
jgi:flagellar biosynthesis protein